jgi:hypothetical protein
VSKDSRAAKTMLTVELNAQEIRGQLATPVRQISVLQPFIYTKNLS